MTQFRNQDSDSKYFEMIPKVKLLRQCKNCHFTNDIMSRKICKKCGASIK